MTVSDEWIQFIFHAFPTCIYMFQVVKIKWEFGGKFKAPFPPSVYLGRISKPDFQGKFETNTVSITKKHIVNLHYVNP